MATPAIRQASYGADEKKYENEHLEHGNNDGDVPLAEMHFGHMSAEERTSAFKLAREIDPGPNTLSMRHLTFLISIFCVIACSCDTGFDTTIMSSVNSMTQFQGYFGLTSASTGTGILFGVYTVGGVTAFFPNIYLPDKIGRRYHMALGNFLLIIGAVISANSKSYDMILGGRWLTGFGASMAALGAKLWVSEVTPASSRGRYMGILNSFYYIGQILATGVAIPLGRVMSEYSWRTCMYLQMGPAIVNLAGVFFICESPRWLYARGHRDRAIDILAKYHSATGSIDSPVVKLEMQEIEAVISLEGGDRQFWNFKKVFDSPGNRYRFGLAAMISVWGQLAGNGLITYFLPTLLGLAGITDRDQQRQLNLVNSCTSMLGALTGSLIVDHVGRRKLLLSAVTTSAVIMFIVGALLSKAGEQSPARANAGVAFIFLFQIFFSFGMTPLQGLYPAEVLSFENRAKGLSLQGWCTNAVSCINTFALPTALGKIDYIVYFIFGAWDIVGMITVYTFAVETKQLSLEELDEVFDAPSPKKRSFELAAAARARIKKEKEVAGALH